MNKPEELDQALRASLQRLPRSVEPERDLWAGIHSQITVAASPATVAPQRRGISIGWAIAASLASLAVGIFVTRGLQREHAPVQQATNLPATVLPAAQYSFVPASTDAVRLKLRESCAAQLANLPPATRAKVEKNLLLIKQAVSDIQSALAKDPGNALLQDLLVSTYQNELDTLANVQALASTAHSEVSI
jgi:hypothetical protein